jgi:hypothetical protein
VAFLSNNVSPLMILLDWCWFREGCILTATFSIVNAFSE